jgi:hypothetical protein
LSSGLLLFVVFVHTAASASAVVLYAPLAGRTRPGCAAGGLPPPPPSHYLNNGPAVRCRSSS